MVAFTLPKNSRLTEGKTYPAPAKQAGQEQKLKTFRV